MRRFEIVLQEIAERRFAALEIARKERKNAETRAHCWARNGWARLALRSRPRKSVGKVRKNTESGRASRKRSARSQRVRVRRFHARRTGAHLVTQRYGNRAAAVACVRLPRVFGRAPRAARAQERAHRCRLARRRRDGRQPHPRDSVLRRALCDDPSNCHYVQTIPRRGYRFIAPVRVIADPAAHVPPPATPEAPSTDVRLRTPAAPPPARWSGRRGALLGGVAVAAAATLAFGIEALSGRRQASLEKPAAASAQRAVRLFQTPPQGATIVSGGVLSPDGESLTFVARDDSGGAAALWLRSLHSAQLERSSELTAPPNPSGLLIRGASASSRTASS